MKYYDEFELIEKYRYYTISDIPSDVKEKAKFKEKEKEYKSFNEDNYIIGVDKKSKTWEFVFAYND